MSVIDSVTTGACGVYGFRMQAPLLAWGRFGVEGSRFPRGMAISGFLCLAERGKIAFSWFTLSYSRRSSALARLALNAATSTGIRRTTGLTTSSGELGSRTRMIGGDTASLAKGLKLSLPSPVSTAGDLRSLALMADATPATSILRRTARNERQRPS
jgi:hypothetical protein